MRVRATVRGTAATARMRATPAAPRAPRRARRARACPATPGTAGCRRARRAPRACRSSSASRIASTSSGRQRHPRRCPRRASRPPRPAARPRGSAARPRYTRRPSPRAHRAPAARLRDQQQEHVGVALQPERLPARDMVDQLDAIGKPEALHELAITRTEVAEEPHRHVLEPRLRERTEKRLRIALPEERAGVREPEAIAPRVPSRRSRRSRSRS